MTRAAETNCWHEWERGQDARAPRFVLTRLLRLLLYLQSSQYPNASRLAEWCGVSRRTIFRDLSVLEQAGVRVAFNPARQGYELVRDQRLKLAGLEDREILGLVFQTRSPSSEDLFSLREFARSGLARILQATSGWMHERFVRFDELFERSEPETCDRLDPQRSKIYTEILQATLDRFLIRVWSLEPALAQGGDFTELAIYRMLRWHGVWSVVGHSSFHGEVRLFGIPWIERLESTRVPFEIPPRFCLKRFLARLDSAPGEPVSLVFAPSIARLALDARWPEGHASEWGAGGELVLRLPAIGWAELTGWLCHHGGQVRVLGPRSLRDRVRNWAAEMYQAHSGEI